VSLLPLFLFFQLRGISFSFVVDLACVYLLFEDLLVSSSELVYPRNVLFFLAISASLMYGTMRYGPSLVAVQTKKIGRWRVEC